jgi:CheY-like chemotaxis protein
MPKSFIEQPVPPDWIDSVEKTQVHKVGKGLSETEKVNVLVIENEDDIRCLLTDILTSDGHKVASAANGVDALEIFNQEPFDLVLTDLGMPVMSGWEVANAIKKLAPEVIIAIITGWGTQFDPSELKKNGIDIVVNKPFRVNQILNLVQEAREIRREEENPRISPP